MQQWSIQLLALGLAFNVTACASDSGTPPTVQVETLVEGVPLHGVQGLTWADDGYLYAAAMSAQKISRIDPDTGAVDVLVDAPLGESDDIAIGPDGTLVYTAMVAGELRALRPDGSVETLASDIRGVNPVGFSPDGRLFAVVLGQPSRLMEFDPNGTSDPRLVSDEIKLLNSFDFSDDGYIYGPFWRSGELVKIDVDTGEQTVLATGLGEPTAAELDSNGQIITVDYHTGEVKRTNPDTGQSVVIVTLDPPLDNLAIGPNDTIYVSDTARSGVYVISPDGQRQGRLLGGEFSTPGGIAVVTQDGQDRLVVADSTGYRFIDPISGRVTRPHFNSAFGTSLNVSTAGPTMALSDPRMGRVHVIDLSTGGLMHDTFGLDTPYGIAAMPSGEVIIAEHGKGTMSVWDGENIQQITDGLQGPVGLVLESHSSTLVTEHASGRLVRVSLQSGEKAVLFEGLDKPEGLAILPDGRIAVAEVGAAQLVAIDPENSTKDVLVSDLNFGIAAVRAPIDIGVPTGVAVGRDGAIYVTEDRRNAVLKVTLQ